MSLSFQVFFALHVQCQVVFIWPKQLAQVLHTLPADLNRWSIACRSLWIRFNKRKLHTDDNSGFLQKHYTSSFEIQWWAEWCTSRKSWPPGSGYVSPFLVYRVKPTGLLDPIPCCKIRKTSKCADQLLGKSGNLLGALRPPQNLASSNVSNPPFQRLQIIDNQNLSSCSCLHSCSQSWSSYVGG